jgi:hypothetical protein
MESCCALAGRAAAIMVAATVYFSFFIGIASVLLGLIDYG